MLHRLLVEGDAVTGDLDRDGKTVHFLADLVVGRGGGLHAASNWHELLALGLAVQLVRHGGHRVFRIHIADAVDVGLLDDGRCSCIGTAGDGILVEDREQSIRIAAGVDVVDGVALSIASSASLHRGYWSVD